MKLNQHSKQGVRTEKRKIFILTESDVVTKIQPLNEYTRKLFYGIPDWAKYSMRNPTTGSILFSDKPF